MNVVIDGYDLRRVTWPMRRTVRNARSTWEERTSLVFELRAGGLVGRGEASPLPGYSRSTIAECEADLAWIGDRIRGQEDPASAIGTRAPFAPPAAFAYETALFDLASRARGLPFWRLLRPDSLDVETIALSTLLDGEDEGAAVASATEARQRGISAAKLKVGILEPAQERRIVEAVRRSAGEDFLIRLDANGSWPRSEVAARLADLAAVSPEYVEDPCSYEDWLLLEPSSVPLAVDEPLAHPLRADRLRQLAGRGLCRVAVIKPSQMGLAAAISLATEAARLGVDVVATHMFEGPIAAAAVAAVALAFTGRRRAAGLDVRAYASWPSSFDPWASREGFISHWDDVGLGQASSYTFE